MGREGLDFTYIQDLIQGVVLCIAKEQAKNQIFNLTFGSSRSLNQLAQVVLDNFPGLKLHHNPRDVLMPERGTLSIDKARNLLGYEPAFSLENGFIGWRSIF